MSKLTNLKNTTKVEPTTTTKQNDQHSATSMSTCPQCDSAKVVMLTVIVVACLMTFWTSPSIQFNNADFRVLSPQLQTHCGPARKALNECEQQQHKKAGGGGADADGHNAQEDKQNGCVGSKADSSIRRLKQNLQICETTVQKAYRDINLGGCPWEIKSVSLCENEWCRGGGGNGIGSSSSCKTECSGVRETLTSCIQRRVQHYFQRAGLKEDGTKR